MARERSVEDSKTTLCCLEERFAHCALGQRGRNRELGKPEPGFKEKMCPWKISWRREGREDHPQREAHVKMSTWGL